MKKIILALGYILLLAGAVWAGDVPNEHVTDPHYKEIPESKKQARNWGYSAGTAIGGFVTDTLGNEMGIKNNIVGPMMTGAGVFSSLDGSNTGSLKKMQQRSSAEFLSLFIIPQATGDVKMNIRVDKDFDGTSEYSYAPDFMVSGVCSNGFISCPPGTWGTPSNHCKYYRWTSSTNADVGIVEVSRALLGGCYCINNDCGNNLAMNNARTILRDLGGGIVAGIQEQNPQYMITDSQIDSFLITYYGNDITRNASYDNSTLMVSSQTSHFENAWNLDADAQNEALSQSTDENSQYSILLKALDKQGTKTTSHSCSITRVITISSVEDFCWEPDIPGIILKQDEKTTYYKILQSSNISYHDDCDFAKPSRYPNYQWTPPSGGPYQILYENPPDARPTGKYLYKLLRCKKRDGKDKGYYDVYRWTFICERTTDLFSEEIVDKCSALAADNNCFLSSEKVDDIQTATHGNPTGLSPLPSTKTFPGHLDAYQFERNWWRKDRVYECISQNKHNWADINQRLRNVKVNMSDDGSWDYTDGRLMDDGSWTSEHYYFGNPNPATPKAGCEYGCKVRKLVSDTDAGKLQHVADVRTAAQTWDFRYRTCTRDNVCPAVAGEQVWVNNTWVPANTSNNAAACQCMNEFADAVGAILTVRMAGNDVICSDGTRKNPDPVPHLPDGSSQ